MGLFQRSSLEVWQQIQAFIHTITHAQPGYLSGQFTPFNHDGLIVSETLA
tara:strand:- start:136 stop:285 length:150 start_codon:yes stop_codon:yes gene_type:complete